MKIIIIGCGRVGEMLAGKLNNVGHDVTIIDLSATKVNEISSRYDIMGVIAHYGLCREDLLQDTINCALPTCVSVGKLLDDDTMRRVY